MSATLAEWLAYQERVNVHSIELGLDRVREVWQRMGAPAPARQVITVGGTNGKGSTVALLEAMLRRRACAWARSPRRTCWITTSACASTVRMPMTPRWSPRSSGSRRRVGGDPADLFRIRHAGGAGPVRPRRRSTWRCWKWGWADGWMRSTSSTRTWRSSPRWIWITWTGWARIATASAARRPASRGQGGRRSSASWIRRRACSRRWPRTARRSSAPASISASSVTPMAGAGAIATAARWNCPTRRWPRRCSTPTRRRRSRRCMRCGRWRWLDARARFFAAVSAACTRCACRRGLQSLGGDPPLVVDVGHNPQAARALAEWLDAQPPARVHAVYGALADKDVAGVIGALGARIDHWHLAGLDRATPRGLAVTALAEILQQTLPQAAFDAHADVPLRWRRRGRRRSRANASWRSARFSWPARCVAEQRSDTGCEQRPHGARRRQV